MSGEAVSPSERNFDRGRDRRSEHRLWLRLVGAADALLRGYYGVFQFTDDPACVFRIALDPARREIVLADGTRVRTGDAIGVLHWWNEQLPRYSGRGPDLGWAGELHRRVRHSLLLLSNRVEHEPRLRPVAAFRAEAAFSGRLGGRQVHRVAARYGFELIDPPPGLRRRFEAVAASLHTWALTRAFNPSALPRQPFLRVRHELWMSRATLLQRYGGAASGAVTTAPRRR